MPEDKRELLTALYGGVDFMEPTLPGLRRMDSAPYPGAYLSDAPRQTGGGGLVSTLGDQVRLVQSLMPGGPTLLRPETIALMTQNQIGRTYSSNGLGFGYGFEVIESPTPKRPEPAGAFGWSGAYGTYYRVAPKEKLVILVYTQLYPNWTDVKDKLAEAIFQSLTGKHRS